MTQDLLGMSAEKYIFRLNRYKAAAIALGAFAVLINALLLSVRTDENHNLLLALSIILTTLFGWAITAVVGIVIKPMARLYELSLRPTEFLLAKIERIDTEPCRVEHFDCLKVYTEDKALFLVADGGIRLREGDSMTLLIASNIITGVRV